MEKTTTAVPTMLDTAAMRMAEASALNTTREETDKMAKDLAEIVDDHALGAGTASAASAWIHGIGSTIAAGAMVAFVYSMYTRLNNRMGLDLSKTSLKKLAGGLVRYLMYSGASIAGTMAISSFLSMTGVGNGVSAILMAAVDYGATKIGGIVYLNIISELTVSGADINKLSDEQLESAMKATVDKTDVKQMMKEMKKEYTEGRKNGTITGNETVETAEEI